MIKRVESLDRRFVHVSIKPQHRKPVNRRSRKSISEPPLQENHPFIQQPIPPKILFYLLSRNGQLFVGVMRIVRVSSIGLGVRRRKPPETVCDKYATLRVAMRLEYPTHVNTCPSPPHTCLNEIPRDVIHNGGL